MIEELQDNLYVDDWLSGADCEEQACEMLEEASRCMEQACMTLSKWGTNSDAVTDKLYHEWEGKFQDTDTIKLLGLTWSVPQDCFFLNRWTYPQNL